MNNERDIDINKLINSIDLEPEILKYMKILCEYNHRNVSVSNIQTYLRVGYNKAKRIIKKLEDLNIVGPYQGNKPRDLLVDINVLERLSAQMSMEINKLKWSKRKEKERNGDLGQQELFYTGSNESDSYYNNLENEKLKEEVIKLRKEKIALEKENSILLKERETTIDNYQLIERSKYKAELDYQLGLKVRENELIVDELLNNTTIIENLQGQYEKQYNTVLEEVENLRRKLKDQEESLSMFKLKHFKIARSIVISTKGFISLLQEVKIRRSSVSTSKNKGEFIHSDMIAELLDITEEALNDLVPICGDRIFGDDNSEGENSGNELSFIMRRFKHITNNYLIKFQKVFVDRGIVPPCNTVLNQINTLIRYREINGIPIYHLHLLYYLALVLAVIAEYEKFEGVGPDFIIEKNKRRVDLAYAKLDDLTREKFPTVKSYIIDKLAKYSQLGKLPKNLYVNEYTQEELTVFNLFVADKFIYDESILETINDYTLFYLCGDKNSGVYKFGVTNDDDATSRIKEHTKTAKKIGIEKMVSLIELKTPHALTIENYFKDKFKQFAERLDFGGPEWVKLITAEEVDFILNGVWESDSQLRYIMSYSFDYFK
ncbi:DNA translocase FtsK [Salinibacillus xinjiangensis]|uniref:FtsK gamma domain-containing protein n=1 Tax=Salinibacillus xinjiangensis TaxID=1229268 RepID=A0A6G1X6X9_9BACI|nr:DNA translocase FtsK [Salinibacillus xinjiangensis]MRG86724.1 hypothetical protein [Salinibacillus xinjiangensis]